MPPELDTPGSPDLDLTDEMHPIFRSCTRFGELVQRRNVINSELKHIETEMNRLEAVLLDYFQQRSLERIRVKGVTIYLRRELWARPKFAGDKERVCRALEDCGLGHFVEPTYNSQTLSAYVRELERLHADRFLSGEVQTVADLLPKGLAAVLNVEPSYKVLGRRSQ